MGSFTYNGVNASTYGINVEEYPIEEGAEKIIENIQVPGRTGTLTIDTGAYANVTRTYVCSFKGTPANARAIRQWLAGASGYCDLTDTYDDGIKRKAKIKKLPDIQNVMALGGKFTISFDCDARKFITQAWDGSLTITNNYMDAKPKFVFKTTTDIIGQIQFTYPDGTYNRIGFVNVGDEEYTITVDCDKQEIADNSEGQLSYAIDEFPKLPHGATTITLLQGHGTFLSFDLNFWQP